MKNASIRRFCAEGLVYTRKSIFGAFGRCAKSGKDDRHQGGSPEPESGSAGHALAPPNQRRRATAGAWLIASKGFNPDALQLSVAAILQAV